MARRIIAVVVFLAWVGFLAISVYTLQDKEIRKWVYQRPYRGTLNLPRIIDSQGNEIGEDGMPNLASVMALGYDSMVASVLWLRVIQAFGAKLQHVAENPQELRAIENLFWVITELDPRFIDAYKFGNFVLGDEGRDTDAALRLLDRGIAKNHNRTYKLAYEGAFISLINLKDYDRARFYVRQAKRAPDCPAYVVRFEHYIDVKKGKYEVALERWVHESMEAHANNDEDVQGIADRQIESVVNQWHISIINAAIDRYFARHEDYPARLDQLVEEGLTTVTRQVNGSLFLRLLDGAKRDERISTEQAVDLIMGTEKRLGRGLVESNRLPVDLRDEPYLLVDEATIPIQKRPVVVERQKKRQQSRYAAFAIRRRLQEYFQEHGKYPAQLTDLPAMRPGSTENLKPIDPTGYPWTYDPATGRVGSRTFPEI